jgi:lipopolysaccharide export system ATP-binding protein
LPHQRLDVADGDRVDAGEGLVEQDEGGLARQRARDLAAPPLAAKPQLMLLDEPFAGVDPISVGEIQRIIQHLKDRGIGVLITDHNVRETLGICDRAYILNEGAVLAQGSPAAILADPDVRRVYLGEAFRL